MIYCQSCGTPNNDGTNFCQSCGARLSAPQAKPYQQTVETQQPVYAQPVYAQPINVDSAPIQLKPKVSRKGLTAGILCMVFSPIFLSVIFGPIAIVKGANVLKKFGKTGSAIAAIVLGVLGILLSIMFACMYFILPAMMAGGSALYYYY